MSALLAATQAGYTNVSITSGEYHASRKPSMIRTVLGSCVAVCLRDPVTGVGGMNHFMLANDSGLSSGGSSARFGIHAMELLINECMKLGADRNRLEAKVFGGGHVMQDMHTAKTVPTGNIAFAMNFLKTESIPIRSIDVGGNQARKVMFFTDSGRILLSRMDCRRNVDDPELKMLKRRVSDKPTAPPAEAGDVTLF